MGEGLQLRGEPTTLGIPDRIIRPLDRGHYRLLHTKPDHTKVTRAPRSVTRVTFIFQATRVSFSDPLGQVNK